MACITFKTHCKHHQSVLTARLRRVHYALKYSTLQRYHSVPSVLYTRQAAALSLSMFSALTALLATLQRAPWLPTIYCTLWERCKNASLV